MPTPTSATNITRQFDDGEMQPRHDAATIGWGDLIDRLSDGGTFWLTTSNCDGRPHTRPVFAVVAQDTVHVASSATATKTSFLVRSAPTSIAVNTPGLDVVWSGTPRRVTDQVELAVVADAYRTVYGWNVTIDASANALTAPYGAPTAGPPPYHVFRFDPATVHAVATDASFAGRSTRWDFTQPTHSSTTRVDRATRTIDAPVHQVFDALIDPTALARWLPPAGMTGHFEHADIRPGGTYRLVLTHDDAADRGKTGDGSDIVEARIIELIPGDKIVHEVDFVADDPTFHGTMTMAWSVAAIDDTTHVEIVATNVPTGISPDDHAAGLESSLANLAAHLHEAERRS